MPLKIAGPLDEATPWDNPHQSEPSTNAAQVTESESSTDGLDSDVDVATVKESLD